MNYILKDENAVYYECGFSCDNEVFLKLGSEAFFITDSRYTTEAEEYVKNAEVIEGDRRNLLTTVKDFLTDNDIEKIIFNPYEWSVKEFQAVQNGSVEFKAIDNFSMQKRIIKSEKELEILKKASILGADAFEKFAGFLIDSGKGLSEKRLHFEAERILKDFGNLDISFSPIVAINENSAKPHSLPTSKVFSDDDLLLFDAGVKFERYCSDRTRVTSMDRVLGFDKKKVFKDSFKQKIYDTVLFAQEAAIKAVRTGIKAKEIDRAAREVIEKAGFGKYFIHSTGHGVGLDIHEFPVISSKSETVIEENMVFTIEPGIYLAGEFGIRIEDTVISRQNGAEVIG